MRIKSDTPVKLKTFLGTSSSKTEVGGRNNYWKLIGERGVVIDSSETNTGKVLVLFDKCLADLWLEHSGPVKNSLWIKKSDLELDNCMIRDRKLSKEISERASFMSNKKWFRLFTEVENKGFAIGYSRIKFLLDDREYPFYFGGFTAVGFADSGVLGPFLYKEIEWILIPGTHVIERWNREEKLAPNFLSQPIQEIKRALDNLGRFELAITEDGLQLFGYK